MRVRVIVVVALGVMLLAGVAGAKTNKLSGKFSVGDGSVNPNATISMKIKTNAKGKPKQAKKLRVENLTYRCVESEMSGEADFAIPGSFKIKRDETSDPPGLYFSDDVDDGDTSYQLYGAVSKKGKKVEGSVTVEFGSPDFCGNSVGGYTAKS